MKPIPTLAAVFFFVCGPSVSSVGKPQKHAPSVTQCRSDAAAWNKEEDAGPKDKDVGYQLSFKELLRRQGEMLDCMMSDSQHGSDGEVVRVRVSYEKITGVYSTAMMVRYRHFIERHQLFEQFFDEDEKGLR